MRKALQVEGSAKRDRVLKNIVCGGNPAFTVKGQGVSRERLGDKHRSKRQPAHPVWGAEEVVSLPNHIHVLPSAVPSLNT